MLTLIIFVAALSLVVSMDDLQLLSASDIYDPMFLLNDANNDLGLLSTPQMIPAHQPLTLPSEKSIVGDNFPPPSPQRLKFQVGAPTSYYSNEALARQRLYFGNPQKLLPLLRRNKGVDKRTFNPKRDPAEFIALPAGLVIPIDDSEISSPSHMSIMEVGSPSKECAPELEWVTGKNGEKKYQVTLNDGPFAIQYDETQSVWRLEWHLRGSAAVRDQVTQVILRLPHGQGCQYTLRHVVRECDENRPVFMAKHRHWHPRLKLLRMPKARGVGTAWVPMLLKLHSYFHAMPEFGWYYPLADIVNPVFDFDFSHSSWHVWRKLAQLYVSFAERMAYPAMFRGNSIEAVDFYNFVLFLGQTFKVKGCNIATIDTWQSHGKRGFLDVQLQPILAAFGPLKSSLDDYIAQFLDHKLSSALAGVR